jgi:hypothetical protein
MPSATQQRNPIIPLQGVVEKINPGTIVGTEQAQISVHSAERMYRELRFENILQDENGEKVCLGPGAIVEVTIEAEKAATTPRK